MSKSKSQSKIPESKEGILKEVVGGVEKVKSKKKFKDMTGQEYMEYCNRAGVP